MRSVLTTSFQSAPPVKGATWFYKFVAMIKGVSIRAPREGGDGIEGERSGMWKGFNPRPP